MAANLHDHLRSRNAARGSRRRDFFSPLEWNRDGIYVLEPSGDSLAERHKITAPVGRSRNVLCGTEPKNVIAKLQLLGEAGITPWLSISLCRRWLLQMALLLRAGQGGRTTCAVNSPTRH